MQTDDLEYFKSKDFQKILRQYEESVKSGHPIYGISITVIRKKPMRQ